MFAVKQEGHISQWPFAVTARWLISPSKFGCAWRPSHPDVVERHATMRQIFATTHFEVVMLMLVFSGEGLVV